MALTRRVAATSVPHQKGSLEGEPSIVELTGTGIGTTPRLDHVPTQRGAFPEVLEPQPLAPAAEPVQERRKGRTVVLVVALTVTGALVAGSAAVAHERSVQVADRHAADLRLAGDRAAQESDLSARYAAQQAAAAAWSTALSSARAAALTAAAAGTQQLAAAPHADPALLAALQAAIDLATTTAADQSASVADVSAAAAGVAAPAKAATDAEAAWQVADQARIAAEQQAAAQAAANAAAAQAAAAARPVVRTPVATKPVTSTATSPAPTGGRVQPIPVGGLVCPGAPVGAPTGEASYSAIGAAINAWRAGQGLPALAIARSGALVGHAEDMAASGGIWHSGFDNIVGCTSGSVTSLINAWANSAPHRAQMVRTDVHTMLIGGATSGGWLYGAVKFS
jgi:hypothetical protein